MSYQDGWSAIHLEMPDRVPRTEYSAESHWDLLKVVTGIDVAVQSSQATKQQAQQAFCKAWNYDFFWNVLISAAEFGDIRTDMGHAEYAAGGVDKREIGGCPFAEPEDVLAFDPWEAFGTRDKAELTRRFEENYQQRCAMNPGGVNMTGIYVTCVSGLIDIFGWEMLLLASGIDSDGFGAVTNRYASWIQQYFDALAASNVPVVMIHDDIVWTEGAIFRPDWYRRYVFPNYKKYFAPLLEAGKKIMYTSDANFTEFIDDVAETGVHGFVMEPCTDMAYIAERYGKTHAFVGNADTRILLYGSRAEIRAEVERCMAIGKNCPGFFMAVGNHIPANTPVENALYYNEVYEELSKR
ncbi:MAG TPA: uroporphyrinogen decarboxylase family protein [Armatimonadota bacterium]